MTISSNENQIEKLLTLNEVVKIFAISKTTLYRMIHDRKIPFCKINGGLRFKASDIARYIENKRIELIE